MNLKFQNLHTKTLKLSLDTWSIITWLLAQNLQKFWSRPILTTFTEFCLAKTKANKKAIDKSWSTRQIKETGSMKNCSKSCVSIRLLTKCSSILRSWLRLGTLLFLFLKIRLSLKNLRTYSNRWKQPTLKENKILTKVSLFSILIYFRHLKHRQKIAFDGSNDEWSCSEFLKQSNIARLWAEK